MADTKNQKGNLCNEEKQKPVQKLRCTVQNYEWGKIGSNSEVYRLYKANCGEREVDPNQPYAEFWMGAHENGSSYVVICGNDEEPLNLKNWIEMHPEVLGEKLLEKWGCHLPFLCKVLSVGKPLSIQTHPSKNLAKQLHLQNPSVYKDMNHKPEMALAITKFEVLCGFLGIQDLQKNLSGVSEISMLVDHAVVEGIAYISAKDGEAEVTTALRHLFTQIMSACNPLVSDVLSHLTNRLREKLEYELTLEEKLVLRLEELYPSDIGILAPFFMNYLTLNPGEALCIGANELHSYISGECIECMSTSDNVVRAGLTPKERDVKTLCDMLSYRMGSPEICKGFNVDGSDGCLTRYCPPFEEFEVDHCKLFETKSATFLGTVGPSLVLVTQGSGTLRAGFVIEKLNLGDVLFIQDNIEISVESDAHLEIYRAGVNSKFFLREHA